MAKKKKTKKTATGSNLVRLNKYIADCGITSRRKADDLIDSGKVKVNGKTTYELGVKIDPGKDKVTLGGRKITLEKKKVYYIFNKPQNVLTSMSDPDGRPTVADYFDDIKERIFPVGRLDWDSEGLLLMTNDGDFAHSIAHPKEEISKTYLVKLDVNPTEAQLEKLKRGVTIIGGKVKAKHVERIRRGDSKKYQWVKIVITEGKNRQVRRMFEKVGCDVMKLQRVAIGHLTLGKLRKGTYSSLKPKDLLKLYEIRKNRV